MGTVEGSIVRRAGASSLLFLVFAALSAGPAFAQKTPEETVRALRPAEGFEVKLFASEPMIVNPIAVDVDTYGRVWVTEGVNYRRNVSNPPDNTLKVLEDTNGDGVADKVTVFAKDLNAAMGVCVAGSKIYVPESPNLYVYEDANNDLIPDGPRKTLLTGFGGKNHDHGTHSQVFGPDHKLYMTNGDTGYDVTGPDGKQIKFRWGGMIRCEADGSKLEDFAVNFRNPVELAVDSFANVWCSDNDNDGLKSVRICWILEGGNYGWFGGPEMIKNPDGSFDPIHHWRADKPGFVPYTLITGFGSPCGMTFLETDAFGSKYQNQIIHCDAGPREIRAYGPKRLPGVGYTASIENIVTATDDYFRPIDPCVAPDGSLIVTDWYDGGVGGHAYNDPTRGRIYKITPTGKKLIRKEKPGPYTNDADALVALASPNKATQFLARERLLKSGEAAVTAILFAENTDRILKARLMWLLDRIGGNLAVQAIQSELKSSDPAFRALAVRILRRHGEKFESNILPMLADSDGEVLKESLLAIPQLKSPAATEALLKTFGRYDGTDRYLLETLAIASKGREPEVFAGVVEKSVNDISPRLVNIVRILRPDDAAAYLGKLLASAKLPEASQQALVVALAAVPTVDAGKSVLRVLWKDNPAGVRALALESLRRNINGVWSGLKNDPEFASAVAEALKNPELVTAALEVIAEGNLKQFGDQVIALIGEGSAKDDLRIAAIGVAARLGLESAGKVLAGLFTGKAAVSAALQKAAISGLVALKDTKSSASLLAEKLPVGTAVKEALIDSLMQTSDGAVFVLRLIDTKKLDKPLADRSIAAAVEHPDVNVRLLFEKFIPVDQRPKTLGQSFKIEDILKLSGDAGRGEQVFARSGEASCNKCHRVNGRGADIGPDLSQIGKKYERKALLETIMNPSAGIAPEYVPYVIETQAGKVYAGFIHQQTDADVTLKTIDGTLVNIAKKDMEEMVKQTVSLMPELVLKNVTAQDAADLLAYLSGLQSNMVFASSFQILGPFYNSRPEHHSMDFGPEKTAAAPDFKATYTGIANAQLKWSPISAAPGTQGVPEIDMLKVSAQRKTATDNVIHYFATALESQAAQSAILHIGSDDGVQVWVNGQKVHDVKATRALKASEDRVKVDLKAGKNQILLKLDQGNGGSGLTLAAEAKANISFVGAN